MADETARQPLNGDQIVEGLTARIYEFSEQLVSEFQELERDAAHHDRAAVERQSAFEEAQRRIAELERLVEEVGIERDQFGIKISEGNTKLSEMQQIIDDRDELIVELRKANEEIPQLKADIGFHLGQNAMLRKDLNAIDLRVVDAEQRRERVEFLLHRLAPTLQPADLKLPDGSPEKSIKNAPALPLSNVKKGSVAGAARRRKRATGATE